MARVGVSEEIKAVQKAFSKLNETDQETLRKGLFLGMLKGITKEKKKELLARRNSLLKEIETDRKTSSLIDLPLEILEKAVKDKKELIAKPPTPKVKNAKKEGKEKAAKAPKGKAADTEKK